jgi:hypothetical protein
MGMQADLVWTSWHPSTPSGARDINQEKRLGRNFVHLFATLRLSYSRSEISVTSAFCRQLYFVVNAIRDIIDKEKADGIETLVNIGECNLYFIGMIKIHEITLFILL